ncbi:unnamed protein product [Auanema sp. JU1783]|nr:unnamed protein product [Auanema sp. JU1783]
MSSRYGDRLTNIDEESVEDEMIVEEQDIECTPGMWAHPMGLFRFFHLAMFFLLQWLVQITCGGDACTMIMNVFGYTALGQVFVLIIFLALSLFCTIVLLLFSLNGHRAMRGLTLALEKVYALLGVVLMFICGLLGTWMAVLTGDPEVNYQGRGLGHIRGQWIAAAVLEFLMVIVYIFDLVLQRRPAYPFGVSNYESEAAEITTKINRAVPIGTRFKYEEQELEQTYPPSF